MWNSQSTVFFSLQNSKTKMEGNEEEKGVNNENTLDSVVFQSLNTFIEVGLDKYRSSENCRKTERFWIKSQFLAWIATNA